jgi:hypothetical protein
MLWITGVKDSTAKLCIYIGSNTKPNRKETIMTTEAYVAPDVLVQQLNTKLTDLETKVSNYANLTQEHRNKVRDLYTQLNDLIADNDGDKESTIAFGELSDILNEVFGNELVFTKEYEVQVRYTLYATFKVTAASEDDARSIAEEIGISADPDWDIDGDNTEVDTWSIDETRVDYIQEA